MRLLLDEMWSPQIASQLRNRGHDVVAVAAIAELRRQPDAVIWAAAQEQSRTVVTENVADFRMLAARDVQQGRSHAGVIFTTNRRFPRHDRRTVGRLVLALDVLLSDGEDVGNRECWLG